MTNIYANIIGKFDYLNNEQQPHSVGKLYKQKDFDSLACKKLYKNFSDGMIQDYISNKEEINYPYIVNVVRSETEYQNPLQIPP